MTEKSSQCKIKVPFAMFEVSYEKKNIIVQTCLFLSFKEVFEMDD